jgi:hypothetical protein
MPEDHSSRPDSALIAWIGAAPPPELTESLPPGTRLHQGLTPRADILVVRAESGPHVLRQLPPGWSGSPIIATSAHDPTPAERMAWSKSGAEDLVSLSALPIAVGRRLKRLQRERGEAESARVRETPAERPQPKEEPDEFPPLRVPRGTGPIPPQLRAWSDALVAYLLERESFVGNWREGRLDRLLSMLHQRERLADAAGDRSAAKTTSGTYGNPSLSGLSWPVLVRRGPSRERRGLEAAEGRIVAVGSDGLILAAAFAVGARQKMVIDLAADEDTNLQLLVQARWQRRTGPDRWLFGLIVLEARLLPL